MRAAATGSRSRARSLFRVGAPFVAILLFIGVTQGINIEDVGVAEARERWASHGPVAYEITYTYRGLGPATVVWDGSVVSEYETDDPRLEDATIHWVDTLFDAVDAVEDDIGGDVLSVEFDDDLGFPRTASLDPDTDETGDEWSFEVLELTPLPAPS